MQTVNAGDTEIKGAVSQTDSLVYTVINKDKPIETEPFEDGQFTVKLNNALESGDYIDMYQVIGGKYESEHFYTTVD